MVIVDTADIAYDLFEKRSSIYSDRTELPMLNDLCVICHVPQSIFKWRLHSPRMGFGWAMPFIRYGEVWRRNRALMLNKFHPAAVVEYHPIQTKHARS
jgi:hypothetical protein